MDSAIAASQPRSSSRKLLYIAIALGLIAAMLTIVFLQSLAERSGAPAIPTLSVVVATQDISAGTKITEPMVEVKALPQTAVIQNAATAKTQVVGQIARYPVASGQQVNSLQLVTSAKVQALSFQIPEGLRGFTIPVSANKTPAPLFAPGDFVDVIVVAEVGQFELPEASPETATTGFKPADKIASTLLQNVQVLAVQTSYVENGIPYDSDVRGDPLPNERVSFVTLALTPEQAQLLWLASQDGKITLSLRAFQDEGILPLPITPNLGPINPIENTSTR